LASASSTHFLKSPWSLCESPLYIDTTLSHVVPTGANDHEAGDQRSRSNRRTPIATLLT
jgi:hypothetical protein